MYRAFSWQHAHRVNFAEPSGQRMKIPRNATYLSISPSPHAYRTDWFLFDTPALFFFFFVFPTSTAFESVIISTQKLMTLIIKVYSEYAKLFRRDRIGRSSWLICVQFTSGRRPNRAMKGRFHTRIVHSRVSPPWPNEAINHQPFPYLTRWPAMSIAITFIFGSQPQFKHLRHLLSPLFKYKNALHYAGHVYSRCLVCHWPPERIFRTQHNPELTNPCLRSIVLCSRASAWWISPISVNCGCSRGRPMTDWGMRDM